MQTPSLGRIVLVTVDPHGGNNGADVAPAVITRVWSDTMVNLRVLLDGPDVAWRTSVPLFADRDELEIGRAKWAEAVNANPSTYHAAYWPPRV